jgi:hypothetical protein
MAEAAQPQQIQIKADDATLKGVYSNMMQVSHTQEEFALDFMSFLPPQAMLAARVVTSPGHLKRIIAALQDNLKKYEDQFGAVKASEAPERSFGFKAE